MVFSAGSFAAGLTVGVVAGLVVPVALLTSGSSGVPERRASDNVFHTTVEELVSGYSADPGAMNIKIGDRPIEITGVLQIAGNTGNDGSLFLGNGRHVMLPVMQAAPVDLARTATLLVGDRISVLCDSILIAEVASPIGKDCRILSVSKRVSTAVPSRSARSQLAAATFRPRSL